MKSRFGAQFFNPIFINPDIYWHRIAKNGLEKGHFGSTVIWNDNIPAFPGHSVIFRGNTLYMSGFMKTVWKISTSALSGRFFLTRNYLQSRRYKSQKQSQCFFPSSTRLSSFHCPPFSTFCPFTGPKEGLKVHWNQGLGSSSLTPFSKIQTYI